MAFGRRTAPAGPAAAAGPRRRGRSGAASTMASNKAIGGPKTKFVDMRAASARRFRVAGAVIGEKFAHLGADMRLGLYTISHPVHPMRRAAAKERADNVKAAATGTSSLHNSLQINHPPISHN